MYILFWCTVAQVAKILNNLKVYLPIMPASNKLADSGSKTNLAPHSRQEESALLILSVLSVYGNAGHQHTARDSAESTPPRHLSPAAFTPVWKIQVKIEKCFC